MYAEFNIPVCITAIVLCFLSGIVLFSFHRKRRSPQLILAIYFIVLGCGMITLLPFLNGKLSSYPHFFRTVLISAYLFPPLAYLYVRQTIRPRISYRDLFHFFPALFYVIDFLPFFLSPASEKIPIINYVLNNQDKILAHYEGWITPAWFHLVFRNLVCLFYGILSVRELYMLRRVEQRVFFKENASTLRWLRIFVLLQWFIFMPYIFLVIIGKPELTYNASVMPFALMSAVSSFLLFFQPSVFYGFKGLLYESGIQGEQIRDQHEEDGGKLFVEEIPAILSSGNKDSSPGMTGSGPEKLMPHAMENAGLIPVHSQLGYLNKEELEMLKHRISGFVAAQSPFLVPGYSINDFAKDSGIPSRKISAYLNNSEETNFRDFINGFRIDYCIRNLDNEKWANLTLEALAGECGFKNRNSFTTAFKKQTGQNPSSFMKHFKQKRA